MNTRRHTRIGGLACAVALVGLSVAGPGTTASAGTIPPRSKWLYEGIATSMSSATSSIQGPLAGITGKGVGVALIDTGVSKVPGLTDGQVVYGPDLSLDSQDPARRYIDGYGHGTHLAGIIAGHALTHNDEFRGLGSATKLTSVKVGSSTGAVDVSQVIAGIDWVVAHRNDDPANPIRVLNLSYGTDSTQDYQIDPLTHAVENAWRAGIIVVVAGGNDGNATRLVDPAVDPYVIAVGSADTANTAAVADDTVSSFSNLGDARRGLDLVAPGRSIISLRAPGSYADTNYPSARVGTSYFRGSGSSQAAAVVSGALALLVQYKPQLTPDQAKYLLTSTCHPLAGSATPTRGCMFDLMASYVKAKQGLSTWAQTWPRSTGTGSLEGARGTAHIADGTAQLTGENDLFGPFSTSAWAAASAKGTAWNGGTWMGNAWTGTAWTTDASGTRCWDGRYWSGRYWSGRYWSSDTWTSITWQDIGWA